ncbi:hypothetical protein GCM10022216_02630 [Sphingobacterium kyonggiense]|uniref:DNA invertase Pin-like site-specific DNA recombinase n=1 Tax=Sphingobacterium kyonggiense TaxID=714075 RepID=A0ABP7Y9S5_9SPHI
MKAMGYVRKSTKDQSHYSLDYQKKSIREYCERNGVELSDIYTDDGESSYTFDRPDFQALEKFIRENKRQVKYLVIFDHDRFSRNLAEALQKIDQLERTFGLTVLAVNEPLDIDTSDPAVFIQRAFKYLMANHELLMIRKRAKMGIRQAQESGRHVSGAPFGYINAREPGGKGKLVVDESRAFIVQRIFRDYLNGVPHYIIHKEAKKIGFTLTGNDSVARVLGNCLYAGLVKVPATPKQPERIIKGLHEPIISEEQYWMVQEMLTTNKRKEQQKPKEDFPLKGLLQSPCCGGKMTAGWSKGNQKKYIYYRCIKHSNVNISGKLLHEKYERMVSFLNLRQDDVDRIVSYVKDELNKELDNRKKQEKVKLEQLVEIERKIDRLEERMINEELEVSTYKKYMTRFKAERGQLVDGINYLKQGAEDHYQQQLLVLPYLLNLTAIFKKSSIAVQHSIMREMFKHGLTFREGAFRTTWINPVFEHNLLILKKEGLLFLEQPNDDPGKIPLRRGGRIRTYDLHIPNVARYRATLHPEMVSPLFCVAQIYGDFYFCQVFFNKIL